jgi:hypothetical protein
MSESIAVYEMTSSLWTWTSPDPQDLFVWNDRSLSYSGQPAGPVNGSGSTSWPIGDPTYYPMLHEAGWIHGRFFRHGNRLDGGRYEFFDCPWETNCVCRVPPYCLGENTCCCCTNDVRESQYWHADYRHQLTFIKRWPTDEEQTVILHFSGLTYFMPYGDHPDIRYRQDASMTFLWGQQGLEHSRDDWRVNYPLNIGFVVKIKTNTRYTLRDRDFVVPVLSLTSRRLWPNPWSVSIRHYHGRNLYYTGFGNEIIQLSSTKATKSPVTFEFGKTDIGDPCTDSKAPALVIYYKNVIDENFQVKPFDVKLQIIPEKNQTVTWSKHSGPDSGTLNNPSQSTATFSNPSKGGLYRFDLNYLDKTTRTQLLLPLAGADIARWLDTEIKAIPAWAREHKVAVLKANKSIWPFITMYKLYRVWTSISGSFFDYTLEPRDAYGRGPCLEHNVGGEYPFVTVNGTVVHGSKINLVLWAVFGRAWGYSRFQLQVGAHVNQISRSGTLDPESSQNAVAIGGAMYDLVQADPNWDIKSEFTRHQVLRMRQNDDSLREENLWPGDEADLSKSQLVRPQNLPTTP